MKTKVLASLLGIALVVTLCGCNRQRSAAEYQSSASLFMISADGALSRLDMRGIAMKSALRNCSKPYTDNQLAEAWKIACEQFPDNELNAVSKSIHDADLKLGRPPVSLKDVGDRLEEFVRSIDESIIAQTISKTQPPPGYPDYVDDAHARARVALRFIKLRLQIGDWGKIEKADPPRES